MRAQPGEELPTMPKATVAATTGTAPLLHWLSTWARTAAGSPAQARGLLRHGLQ
jgi:hypothetical protein